jgi:hypothetical protein
MPFFRQVVPRFFLSCYVLCCVFTSLHCGHERISSGLHNSVTLRTVLLVEMGGSHERVVETYCG